MHEQRYRRRGWTQGLQILLADGSAWHFPKLDFAMMATTSGIQWQMVEVLQLALETQNKPDGTVDKLKMAMYYTQMSILAILLLNINYEMADLDWERLSTFGSLPELVNFSEQTSLVFYDTSEIWMPFVMTNGPINREVLSLN